MSRARELAARLSRGGGDLAADLGAALAGLETAQSGDNRAEAEDLRALLGALALRLGQDRVAWQGQVQQAQFAARHAGAAAERRLAAQQPAPGRLNGQARAMGTLFARALARLPEAEQKRLFGAGHYLRSNPDVAGAGLAPLAHYIASGAAEGRPPADLRALVPEAFAPLPGTPLLPADIGDLATLAGAAARGVRPGFAEEFPPGLRDEALALAGRARPAISVILPSWNRAHVLARAVTSALLQSLAPAEVIVIDDGSTDGTQDMLRARFPEALESGQLVSLARPHEGVAAARNAGLAAAQGAIIAYLDSDNTWEPDHLLMSAAALLAGPGRQAAYTALARHNLGAGWSDVLFHPYDRAALEAENIIDLNSFTHLRELHAAHGGFDEGLTRLVDWDLILRYTGTRPPVALPVITGAYFIDRRLGNISLTEEAAPNLARIRARQQGQGT